MPSDRKDGVGREVGDQSVVTGYALPDFGACAQPGHEPVFREGADFSSPRHVAKALKRRAVVALPAANPDLADRTDLEIAALEQGEGNTIAGRAEALGRAVTADVEQRIGSYREVLGALEDRLNFAFNPDRDGPVIGGRRGLEAAFHVGRGRDHGNRSRRDGPGHQRAPPPGLTVLPAPLKSPHKSQLAPPDSPWQKHFGGFSQKDQRCYCRDTPAILPESRR